VISTSKPIRDVADAYGVGTETLRNWLIKYRDANGGKDSELTVPERARLKELEREVQKLKAEALNRPGFVGDFDVPWVSWSRVLRIPCVTVWFPRIVSRTRRGCASPTLSGAVFGCETPRDTRISRWLIRGESAMLSYSEARFAWGPK